MESVTQIDGVKADQQEPETHFDRKSFLDSLSAEEIRNTPVHPLHQELLHFLFADNIDAEDQENWELYLENWTEHIAIIMTDVELASLSDTCSSLQKGWSARSLRERKVPTSA